jgi:hypothetical protein
MSWNLPSDDDMANDTDECQALIEVYDDEDIRSRAHVQRYSIGQSCFTNAA